MPFVNSENLSEMLEAAWNDGYSTALSAAAQAIDAAYKAESDELTSPSYLHALYDARALVRALGEAIA